jgi:hypothetical protein
MLDWLRKRLAPRWTLVDKSNSPWRAHKQYPTIAGWYRVMISGDSETDGPHVFYDYPDYETWAWFQTPEHDDEPDYVGTFTGIHDEETEMVFAWCGPFYVPTLFP